MIHHDYVLPKNLASRCLNRHEDAKLEQVLAAVDRQRWDDQRLNRQMIITLW